MTEVLIKKVVKPAKSLKPTKPLNTNERKQLNLIEESQPNTWKPGDGEHFNERRQR